MTILRTSPSSPRALYGNARALDQLAEKKHSNSLLQKAIDTYERVLALGALVPDKLFLQAAERCINRMRFKGENDRTLLNILPVSQYLIGISSLVVALAVLILDG
jgi:aspartate beta-hydroxylase